MVMLKDNHIWAHGSITEAVKSAQRVAGFSMKIEVECTSLDEAKEAITAGADIVMLDNFSPQQLSTAAQECQLFARGVGKSNILVEVSGGITEDNIVHYFMSRMQIFFSVFG